MELDRSEREAEFASSAQVEHPIGMRLRMETPPQVSGARTPKGSAGLIFALIIVVVAAVMSSAARWFILISIPIGLIAAVVLRLWNKYRPVKPEDVDNRPLKLD